MSTRPTIPLSSVLINDNDSIDDTGPSIFFWVMACLWCELLGARLYWLFS